MRLDVASNKPDPRPWYTAGLNFTCTQCGNCCTGPSGHVWLTDEELQRLANHLKLTVQATADRFCRKFGDRWSLQERRNLRNEYDCIFLDEKSGKRTCRVYPVRPLQCRTWPFWEGNLADPENWRRSSQRCPGMNNGKHYTKEEIETLRDAPDWPENGSADKRR